MTRLLRSAASLALVATLAPSPAAADEYMPNVLLLVDSSGSMEYKAKSADFPQCNPTGSGTNERSRWIDLIEVLTGTIQDYRCQAVDRRASGFFTEFALPGNISPIDNLYRNNYHRPLSGSCGYGPNNSALDPTDAFKWTEPFLHEYASPSVACTGEFLQNADGLIDVYSPFVRFGLMTFDTLPGAGTGYSGTASVYADGVEGGWSYIRGSVCRGLPEGCTEPEDFEVGARNPAAPPWEGRLIPFGKSNPSQAEHTQRNEQVEKVLLSTRPYGASPLAGLLHDAFEFLTMDDSEVPYVGPQADDLVANDCRKQIVILLTDGEPNLDLRPFCEATGGMCPFDRSHEIAGNLASDGIDVYVVGFATASTTGGVDCKALEDEDILTSGGLCASNPGDQDLQACCTLHRIAYEGGTERAFFAEDQTALRAELGAILGEASKQSAVTSRTRPAVARANPTLGQGSHAYRFLSGYESNASLWGGHLVRQRYECGLNDEHPKPPGEEEEDPNGGVDPAKGDDFVANLGSGVGPERTFYTVLADEPARTVRPSLGDTAANDPDGLGIQGGTEVSGGALDFVTQVAVNTAAMPTDPAASNCAPEGGNPALTAAQCAERVLKWTLGLENGTDHRRCNDPDPDVCGSPLMGAILRSTPRMVDLPNALTQEETYSTFVAQHRERPLMLYTSTNDGFLHAFKVQRNGAPGAQGEEDAEGGGEEESSSEAVHELRNNELWAYMPPAVLPALQGQYPNVYQRLLDGEPVVKDVVAEQTDTALLFQRSVGAARDGTIAWRTVLVQSFGEGRPGYFALDITDPEAGPRLLWQLTTAANGQPLFGSGGMPLITTIFVGTGANAKEVAVAVLPGGKGGAPTGSDCPRKAEDFNYLPSDFQPRSRVNCYPASATAAMSVTIVRLDTGEVLRTFRNDIAAIPTALGAGGFHDAADALLLRSSTAEFDSPVTGRPVSFPSDVGAVADRIFLGDQDGTLWRIDVSEPEPSDWEVKLFFDGYTADESGNPEVAALKGQPLETPPILSMDEKGRITVNFSTGDQEALFATDVETYVWSLYESLDTSGHLTVGVNWYMHFADGKRVVGPMVLMNSALYFTSYTPAVAVCGDPEESGTSEIYGVDFARAVSEDKPEDGPILTGFLSDESNPLTQPGLVSGLALMQLPSCYETVDTTQGFFPGYAASPRPRGAAPGLFQLTFHTGKTESSAGAGGINAGNVAIAPPASVSRIDSWAAIVD